MFIQVLLPCMFFSGYCLVLKDQSNSTAPSGEYTIDHLVNWILEEKVHRVRLEGMLEGLATDLKLLEQTVSALTHGMTINLTLPKLDTDHNDTTLSQLESRLDAINRKCDSNTLNIDYLNRSTENIDVRLRNLSANIVAKSDLHSFAFSAHNISTRSPWVGDDLVFSQTQLDEHGTYNHKTGQFTAPIDGIYTFHATLCTHDNMYIYANFVAHGKDVGSIRAGHDGVPDCSSGSATVRLNKGDQVSLRTMSSSSGTVIYDDANRMNSFSGHLVISL